MSDNDNVLGESIDYLSRGSGLGSLSEAFANITVGINHRGVGNPVPYNQDNQGLTFFTRPRLNLSYNNLTADRRMSLLGAGKGRARTHYHEAVRQWLDPEVAKIVADGHNTRFPLVDPKCAFIPWLTNNLISLNGWPDPVTENYIADAGLAKETWGMVDGIDTIYHEYTLNASFRNISGDPISLLLEAWRIYMSLVYQGKMLPYPDSEMLREIDYQTRIYRLILDPTRSYVQKIAACGVAWPMSSALGQAFDFASDTPFMQDRASQISVPFQAIGAMYQDPIIMQEFNDVVEIFNPDMADGRREQAMVKIPRTELVALNYHGYPRIDMDQQNELQWWMSKEDYATVKGGSQATTQQPINQPVTNTSGEPMPPRTIIPFFSP